MDFEKVKEVAELVGLAAIVASLIFVGLQLKQSQDIALATQYRAGFLPEEAWQAQLRNTKGIFADCPMRFVYEWRKRGLRAQFVELVESLDDTCGETD